MKTHLKTQFLFILIIPLVISCSQLPKDKIGDNQAINIEPAKKLKNIKTKAEITSTTENETISLDDEDIEILIEQELDTINFSTLTTIISKTDTSQQTATSSLMINSLTPLPTPSKSMKIAAMLPLTGFYKEIGLELQKRVMAEYFNLVDKPKKISFYDSNTVEINQFYHQLIKKQYTTIIGPLATNQIEKINYSTQIINIPLNRIEKPYTNTYAFNFKEYNDQEIEQISTILGNNNHQNILLITNNSISGETFADKLSTQLFNEGKNITKIIYLSADITEDAKKIRSFLTQQPTLKKHTYNQNGTLSIKEDIQDDFPYIRQDIDAIVVSIEAKDARLINALLKTIGGKKIEVYASSLLSKSTDFNIDKEQGLNAIFYLDSSWKYTHANNNFLSALIQDAMRIAFNIQAHSSFIYQGLTGNYTIKKPIGMTRQQDWYQIQKSKAQPIRATIN